MARNISATVEETKVTGANTSTVQVEYVAVIEKASNDVIAACQESIVIEEDDDDYV